MGNKNSGLMSALNAAAYTAIVVVVMYSLGWLNAYGLYSGGVFALGVIVGAIVTAAGRNSK